MLELAPVRAHDAGQVPAEIGAAEGTDGAAATPPDDDDGTGGDKVSRAADRGDGPGLDHREGGGADKIKEDAGLERQEADGSAQDSAMGTAAPARTTQTPLEMLQEALGDTAIRQALHDQEHIRKYGQPWTSAQGEEHALETQGDAGEKIPLGAKTAPMAAQTFVSHLEPAVQVSEVLRAILVQK